MESDVLNKFWRKNAQNSDQLENYRHLIYDAVDDLIQDQILVCSKTKSASKKKWVMLNPSMFQFSFEQASVSSGCVDIVRNVIKSTHDIIPKAKDKFRSARSLYSTVDSMLVTACKTYPNELDTSKLITYVQQKIKPYYGEESEFPKEQIQARIDLLIHDLEIIEERNGVYLIS